MAISAAGRGATMPRRSFTVLSAGFFAAHGFNVRAADGPNRDVSVVALTAHALEQEARASREAGMVDHLVKPVTPQQLARVLARHARRT